jgi:hypothetical protein
MDLKFMLASSWKSQKREAQKRELRRCISCISCIFIEKARYILIEVSVGAGHGKIIRRKLFLPPKLDKHSGGKHNYGD